MIAMLLNLALASTGMTPLDQVIGCHHSYQPITNDQYEIFSRADLNLVRETKFPPASFLLENGGNLFRLELPQSDRHRYGETLKFKAEIPLLQGKKVVCFEYKISKVGADQVRKMELSEADSCATAPSAQVIAVRGVEKDSASFEFQKKIAADLKLRIRLARKALQMFQKKGKWASETDRQLVQSLAVFDEKACLDSTSKDWVSLLRELSDFKALAKSSKVPLPATGVKSQKGQG